MTDPEETVEHVQEVGGGHAHAFVGDAEKHRGAVRARAHPDRGAVRRVFAGIVEHVHQRLLEQHRIGAYRHPVRDRHRDPERVGDPAERRRDHVGEQQRLERGADTAAFQPDQVGDVGEEPRHPADIILDRAEQVGAGVGRQRVPRGAERPRCTLYAGQRGA